MQLAVRVGRLPGIGALSLGIGVHHADALGVVHEHIVAVAIADGARGLLGTGLRLVQGHGARIGLGREMRQHAHRAFDLRRDQVLTVLPQNLVQGIELQRHRKDAEGHRNPDHQGQFT